MLVGLEDEVPRKKDKYTAACCIVFFELLQTRHQPRHPVEFTQEYNPELGQRTVPRVLLGVPRRVARRLGPGE